MASRSSGPAPHAGQDIAGRCAPRRRLPSTPRSGIATGSWTPAPSPPSGPSATASTAQAESPICLYRPSAPSTNDPGAASTTSSSPRSVRVHWFNEVRLHSSIGHVPPLEYETDHYRHIDSLQQPLPENPASTEAGAVQSATLRTMATPCARPCGPSPEGTALLHDTITVRRATGRGEGTCGAARRRAAVVAGRCPPDPEAISRSPARPRPRGAATGEQAADMDHPTSPRPSRSPRRRMQCRRPGQPADAGRAGGGGRSASGAADHVALTGSESVPLGRRRKRRSPELPRAGSAAYRSDDPAQRQEGP